MEVNAVGYSNEDYQANNRRAARVSRLAGVYAVVSAEDSTLITVGHRFG